MGAGELAEVWKDNSVYSYEYDHTGLRTGKTVDGVTTSMITDGMYVVAEYVGANSTYYYRGMNLMGYVSDDEIGYYRFNAHGDVVAVVDTAGGIVTEYSYDPFGKLEDDENEWLKILFGIYVEDDNPFRYCAEYYDSETESIYLRARYYSPDLQRFISEDKIGVGSNWYTYCHNEPIDYVDPTGKWEEGDELLPEKARNLIMIYTLGYNNARSETAKEYYHQKAQAVRESYQQVTEQMEKQRSWRWRVATSALSDSADANVFPVLDVQHQTQQGIHQFACLLVCCAMVFAYYGSELSAKDLFDAYGRNFYVYYDKVLSLAGLEGKLSFDTKTATTEEIYSKCIEELNNGNPVIVEIGYTTKDGEAGTHSVVVYGMTGEGTQASDFLAMDPWRNDELSPKTGELNTLQDSINMFSNDSPSLKKIRIFTPINNER